MSKIPATTLICIAIVVSKTWMIELRVVKVVQVTAVVNVLIEVVEVDVGVFSPVQMPLITLVNGKTTFLKLMTGITKSTLVPWLKQRYLRHLEQAKSRVHPHNNLINSLNSSL